MCERRMSLYLWLSFFPHCPVVRKMRICIFSFLVEVAHLKVNEELESKQMFHYSTQTNAHSDEKASELALRAEYIIHS